MKFLALVVFSTLICCAFSKYEPTPSPVPFSGISVATLTKVIGQYDFTHNDLSAGIQPYSIGSPYGLRTIPAGLFGTGNSFSQGGLLAVDYDYDRVLFYANPIPTQFANATFVFGQSDFTNDGDSTLGDIYDLTYDSSTIYILDGDRVFSYSSTTFTSGGSNVITPSVTWGNAASGYYALNVAYGIQFDTTTGRIYIVDEGCERVVYWSDNPSTDTAPAGVIGNSAITICDDCTDSSSFSCLDEPRYITIDCHGGLWIYDYTDNAVYYFQPGSSVSSFGLTGPSTSGHTTDFDDVQAMSFDPTCSYLAVAGYYLYILSISFTGVNANQPSSSIVYGSESGSSGSPTADTTSVYDIYGVTWDVSNQGFMWVSDSYNNRLVYFNALSGSVSSASSSHSVGGSSAASSTNSPSFGSTPSNSPSRGSIASSSPSPSPSPSQGPSCTTSGNCQTCTDNNQWTCGGSTFIDAVSCVQPSQVSSGSDAICSLSTSTYYCVPGSNLTSNDIVLTFYTTTIQTQQYQVCVNNSNKNPSCCSSTLSCPVTCSAQPTGGQTRTYTQPNTGNLPCYDYCTSCSGYGFTTTYCDNNCDKNGSGLVACSGSPCCELVETSTSLGGGKSSVGNLASWLSYLF